MTHLKKAWREREWEKVVCRSQPHHKGIRKGCDNPAHRPMQTTRYAFEHRDETASKGRAARALMRKRYSPEAVAAVVTSELRRAYRDHREKGAMQRFMAGGMGCRGGSSGRWGRRQCGGHHGRRDIGAAP